MGAVGDVPKSTFFLALPMLQAQQIAAFNMTREAELEGKQANDFRGSVRIYQ